MTTNDDRTPNADHERIPADEDLGPRGEGLAETHLHPTYEAMALRNDLVRQLEDTLAGARAWARADGSEEALDIAEALSELYERLDESSPPG